MTEINLAMVFTGTFAQAQFLSFFPAMAALDSKGQAPVPECFLKSSTPERDRSVFF